MPFFPSSHHTRFTDQPHLPDLDPLFRPLVRLEVRKLAMESWQIAVISLLLALLFFWPGSSLTKKWVDVKWVNFFQKKTCGQMSLA